MVWSIDRRTMRRTRKGGTRLYAARHASRHDVDVPAWVPVGLRAYYRDMTREHDEFFAARRMRKALGEKGR